MGAVLDETSVGVGVETAGTFTGTVTAFGADEETATAPTALGGDVDSSAANSAVGPHFSSLWSVYFSQYTLASASQILVLHQAMVAEGNPEKRTKRDNFLGNSRYWSYCTVPVEAD